MHKATDLVRWCNTTGVILMEWLEAERSIDVGAYLPEIASEVLGGDDIIGLSLQVIHKLFDVLQVGSVLALRQLAEEGVLSLQLLASLLEDSGDMSAGVGSGLGCYVARCALLDQRGNPSAQGHVARIATRVKTRRINTISGIVNRVDIWTSRHTVERVNARNCAVVGS